MAISIRRQCVSNLKRFFWPACARPGCRRNEHNAAGGSTCRQRRAEAGDRRGGMKPDGLARFDAGAKRANPEPIGRSRISRVCRDCRADRDPAVVRGRHRMCEREAAYFAGKSGTSRLIALDHAWLTTKTPESLIGQGDAPDCSASRSRCTANAIVDARMDERTSNEAAVLEATGRAYPTRADTACQSRSEKALPFEALTTQSRNDRYGQVRRGAGRAGDRRSRSDAATASPVDTALERLR